MEAKEKSTGANLGIHDTNVLKGIALIMLLVHHLFGDNSYLYSDFFIGQTGLWHKIGTISNVCVAIFVLLSGYGLAKQSQNRSMDYSIFYKHRLLKLLLSFWPIFILFVSIDYVVFGRTFEYVYQNDIAIKLLADFLGIIYMFGIYGYNPTWWFIGCILFLYLLYPLLYRLLQNNSFVTLIMVIVISLIPMYPPVFSHFYYIIPYLFPFVLGMILAIFPPSNNVLSLVVGGLVFDVIRYIRKIVWKC